MLGFEGSRVFGFSVSGLRDLGFRVAGLGLGVSKPKLLKLHSPNHPPWDPKPETPKPWTPNPKP